MGLLPSPKRVIQMLLKKWWSWIGFLVLLTALATACADSLDETGQRTSGTVPETIVCQLFYRPSPRQAFDETTLTLPTTGDRQSLDFTDLRFEAVTVADIGEGKSLAIAVTDLETGREVARTLYQFDPQQGLIDQFIGGHGFTGLAYVFHPISDAEIQYFCQASPSS